MGELIKQSVILNVELQQAELTTDLDMMQGIPETLQAS